MKTLMRHFDDVRHPLPIISVQAYIFFFHGGVCAHVIFCFPGGTAAEVEVEAAAAATGAAARLLAPAVSFCAVRSRACRPSIIVDKSE